MIKWNSLGGGESMDLIKLGRSGLSVSPLVLGTVNFSWLTNEKDSFAILDRALELGINFFDTSDNYNACLLYTSPSPRDLSTSRMPSSA